jgi:hypothetical protein
VNRAVRAGTQIDVDEMRIVGARGMAVAVAVAVAVGVRRRGWVDMMVLQKRKFVGASQIVAVLATVDLLGFFIAICCFRVVVVEVGVIAAVAARCGDDRRGPCRCVLTALAFFLLCRRFAAVQATTVVVHCVREVQGLLE